MSSSTFHSFGVTNPFYGLCCLCLSWPHSRACTNNVQELMDEAHSPRLWKVTVDVKSEDVLWYIYIYWSTRQVQHFSLNMVDLVSMTCYQWQLVGYANHYQFFYVVNVSLHYCPTWIYNLITQTTFKLQEQLVIKRFILLKMPGAYFVTRAVPSDRPCGFLVPAFTTSWREIS